ncbi:hypothetical protein PpBr36_01334 [Pyricularia pennisetigena]|uniref:hypothetical protein n=1 Tax=Pyricularia pennisetigena TaxID=1578925 RepID=UPI00115316B6|nr:hypothetical protein PpBr36_01334 [Pyricularia pennisetigena]TLS28258.1 hypothetical protein PpBr36_01334 [Pyricularia pennisetigena]
MLSPASEAVKPSKRDSVEESPRRQDVVAVQRTTEDGPNDDMLTRLHQETDTRGPSKPSSPGDVADKVRPATPQTNPCGRDMDSLGSGELATLDSGTSEEAESYADALAISSEPSQTPPQAAAAAVQDRERGWTLPGPGLSDPFVEPDKMAATLSADSAVFDGADKDGSPNESVHTLLHAYVLKSRHQDLWLAVANCTPQRRKLLEDLSSTQEGCGSLTL